MKKQFFPFLLLIALAAGAVAQTAERATDVERNLRSHIEYLASDKLEGRRTGEPGATLASEYIASEFKKLKLRTANGATTYFQPFPYVTGVAAASTGNEFHLHFVDDGPTNSADIRPAGFSPNADIPNTPIVFAGFGIVSADQNRDDYSGVDAKGKIVLVLDGNPENDNPHSLLGRFDARTKALIARDKGAIGIVIISREAKIGDDKLARMAFDQTLGEAALPTLVVPRATAATILGMSDADLGLLENGRSKRESSSTPASADFKVRLVKKTSEARNVIGVLPGTDPILKNEVIVIGAHYDHLGHGGQGSLDVNSTAIHHGADDNASGTAAVIELARQFAAERKNKRTIVFMAFSGEEEGLIGSQYYVNHPLFPLEKTVAMINLDMVG
ncbi:MAG TPA: M20/M25/M40 family metallo-hydrolase, partial [Pyrinomonadaceae bacterium]|nr:M20/M25/M40 family metallo-hydrolase [Pyrinomonadaceae bacterium]